MPRTVVIGHNCFLLSTYEYRLLQHRECCSSLVGFKYTLSLFSGITIAYTRTCFQQNLVTLSCK
nr:MAG TPA: hypothetical protein [Caudoviricetes sp.]